MFALSLRNPQSGSLMNNLSHSSRSEETDLLQTVKLFRAQTNLEVGRHLLPRRAAVPPRTVCVSVCFPERRRRRRTAAGGRRWSWEHPAAPNTAEGEPDGRRNRTARRFQLVRNIENQSRKNHSGSVNDFKQNYSCYYFGNSQDLFS